MIEKRIKRDLTSEYRADILYVLRKERIKSR